MRRQHHLRNRAVVFKPQRHIWLLQPLAVEVYATMIDAQPIARQPNHTLDVALRVVARILKNHHIALVYLTDLVRDLVDEQAILVLQLRQHARAFHADRLIEKQNNKRGNEYRDYEIEEKGRHPNSETQTPPARTGGNRLRSRNSRAGFIRDRCSNVVSLLCRIPFVHPVPSFHTHLDAAAFASGLSGRNPSPGTSILPSIPAGDHASTIALAIFAIVSSPSLSAVQPVS